MSEAVTEEFQKNAITFCATLVMKYAPDGVLIPGNEIGIPDNMALLIDGRADGLWLQVVPKAVIEALNKAGVK